MPEIAAVLNCCSELFSKNEDFSLSNKTALTAVNRYPRSETIDSVLPKVIIINSMYSTAIYDTTKIARHIVSKRVDKKLIAGDVSAIEDIRRGHGIRSKRFQKEFDFLSFATKYCAFHRPDSFPMYDSLVSRLLTKLNRKFSYHSKFLQTSLRKYDDYVCVINSLADKCGLSSLRYKKLDQGLWIYAKYLFDRRGLSREDIEVINDFHKRINF